MDKIKEGVYQISEEDKLRIEKQNKAKQIRRNKNRSRSRSRSTSSRRSYGSELLNIHSFLTEKNELNIEKDAKKHQAAGYRQILQSLGVAQIKMESI